MHFIRKIFPKLLVLVSPGLILGLLVSTWSKVPFEDQWDVPGYPLWAHAKGQSLLEFLFIQHNESRKAVTSLVWYGLSRWGWDCRVEMLAAYLMFAAAFALYLRLLGGSGLKEAEAARRLHGPGVLSRFANGCTAFLPALASAVVFTPFAVGMWTWGVNVENALLILLLMTGITIPARIEESAAAWAVAATLSTLATFTYLNGFVFWVIFCPLWSRLGRQGGKLSPRATLLALAGYLAAFASVLLFYFHGYVHPPGHPSVLAGLSHPVLAVIFFLAMLGAPFTFDGPASGVMAVLIGLFSLAAFVIAVWRLARREGAGATFRTLRPWLVLCAYSFLSVFMITVGRVGRGFYTALAERYYNHTMPFHLAAPVLILLAWRRAGEDKLVRAAAVAGLAVYFLAVPASLAVRWTGARDVADTIRQERTLGELALACAPLAPNNEMFRLLYGLPEVPSSRGSDLIRFGVLRVPFRPSDLSSYEVQPVDGAVSFGKAICTPFCHSTLTVVLPHGIDPPGDGLLALVSGDGLNGAGIRYLTPLGDKKFLKGRRERGDRYEFSVPVPSRPWRDGELRCYVLTAKKG